MTKLSVVPIGVGEVVGAAVCLFAMIVAGHSPAVAQAQRSEWSLTLAEPPPRQRASMEAIQTPESGAQRALAAAPFVFLDDTLHVTEGAFRSNENYAIGPRMTIDVAASAHAHLSGVLSNAPGSSEGLVKMGAGSLRLSGENTYAGSTLLLEGSLHAASNEAWGAGMLQANKGTSLSYSDGITVWRGLQIDDQLTPHGSGGAAALGGVTAGYEDVLVWEVPSGTATHAGILSGPAGFVKEGAGVLDIRGDALGFAGHAVVREGALAVNELFGGPVTVERDAALRGSGWIGPTSVRGGARLEPGNAGVGVLGISGDLRFDTGSVFVVDAPPAGPADKVYVTGRAWLDGDVMALAQAGAWKDTTEYVILEAAQGFDDTRFASVRTDLAFLSPHLRYEDTEVVMILARNDKPIDDVVDDPDEKDIGEIIDDDAGPSDPGPPDDESGGPSPGEPATPTDPTPEDSAPVVPDIPTEPGPDVEAPPQPPEPSEPNEPEGPTVPANPETPIDDDQGDPDDRNEAEDPAPAGGDEDAGNPSDDGPYEPAESDDASPTPVQKDLPALHDHIIGMDESTARRALRQLSGSWNASIRSSMFEDSRFLREAVLAHANHDGPWVQSFHSWAARDAQGVTSGDDRSVHGVVAGINGQWAPNWLAGAYLGMQESRMNGKSGLTRARIDGFHFGLTSSLQRGPMRFTGGLAHTWFQIDSRRRIAAGNLHDVLRSNHAARTWQVFAELSWPFVALSGSADPLPKSAYFMHSTERAGNISNLSTFYSDQLRPRRWVTNIMRANTASRSWGEDAYKSSSWWEPFLRLAWVQLRSDEYSEQGGPAALGVDGSRSGVALTSVGLRYTQVTEHKNRKGATALYGQLAWNHAGGAYDVYGRHRFLQSTKQTVFHTQGIPVARHSLSAELGLTASFRNRLSVGFAYTGLVGKSVADHGFKMAIRWAF